ncbi:hypothetical protein F8388_023177 [Cannabis sativa]|uniref:RNase H type-1 domain-containing protein n=1 Tax=Cannabis sativa TaxID=3483 RepID=A0A7J6HDF1_CANSA|nr:hypothetical protein F8388_023177 [Cannabis sativa]KAF4396672.1 hypothetical protein G4B88_028986 [Cannabis sativa]
MLVLCAVQSNGSSVDLGEFGSMSISLLKMFSVTDGELEAIGKGAEVLRRVGIEEVDILSDNQVIVQALSALVTPLWNVSFLFSKVLTMLSSMKVEVLWIPRTKNSSTHALAEWGLFNNYKGFLSWWDVTPHVLTNILNHY